MVDALLSAGNSGSPVFAVSCRTSEPELVGVFHAGYAEAAALNVVVAVDQLREELDTLRLPRRDAGLRSEITAQDRDRVVKQLSTDKSQNSQWSKGQPAGPAVVTVHPDAAHGMADGSFARLESALGSLPIQVRQPHRPLLLL